MAKRKTKPHGDPAAAANPVAEDNGAAAPIDPGAAASLESDDGPLPEELEEAPEGEEEPDEHGEDAEAVEAAKAPKAKKVALSAEVKPAADPRAELRKRLGEPTPDFPGAIVDPQTGRCENAPPGWDPKRRPPQKP